MWVYIRKLWEHYHQYLYPAIFSGSISSWYGLIRSCSEALDVSFGSVFLFSRAKVLLTVLRDELLSAFPFIVNAVIGVFYLDYNLFVSLKKCQICQVFHICTAFPTPISNVSCAHQCIMCMFMYWVLGLITSSSKCTLTLRPGWMYSSANWCGFSNVKAFFFSCFPLKHAGTNPHWIRW